MGKWIQSTVTTLTVGCLGFQCDFEIYANLSTPFFFYGAKLNSETLSQDKTDIEKLNLNYN